MNTIASPSRLMLLSVLLFLTAQFSDAAQPAPTAADVSYGPSPIQLLDVYAPAQKGGPWPVLIWYGGIWKPAKHPADPNRFLSQGCAVVAVQTRTMADKPLIAGEPPVAIVMHDAVRAVQFIRLNAAKWNLDPDHIAVGGGSQGTLPALYVGCCGEKMDSHSSDPVERVSSKVICVAAYRSQPTIDPKLMQEWVPGVKWGAPALGCSFEDSLKRREELLPLIERWSPDRLVSKDSPPIYFENEWPLTQPADVTEVNYKVHSPAWAVGFQKIARQRGAVCYVKFPGHPSEKYKDIWDFLVQEMKGSR